MNQLQLNYVIIYVPNAAAAVDFYERAFGLELKFIHESGAYAEMNTGNTSLAFADEKDTSTCHAFEPNRASSKLAAGAEVAFVTDDVQAAHKRAVQAGATSLVEPSEKPWGQTIAYVRDLNGFLVELCTPAPR